MLGFGAIGQLALGQIPRDEAASLGFGWPFEPFSEPVRPRYRRVIHPSRLGFFANPNLPPPVLASQWMYGWSEPVHDRIKPTIHVSLQSFNFKNILPLPALEPVSRWIYPWSEPVRIPVKRQVKPWEYQFFASPPRLLPPADVFVTMDALETNRDIFSASIVLYNPAVAASVSIKEISALGRGAISIEG